MEKRTFSMVLALALVAGLFTALPARAQDAPAVPEVANIEDPQGDSNGHSAVTGQGGGVTVGAADFLKVWFTNDAANLYVHIHTTRPAFTGGSIWYSIYVDPGVGADCMEFRGFTQHQAVAPIGRLILTGDCGAMNEVVEFKTQPGPDIDGAPSGVHTITAPRSLSEHLADGKTLAVPNALDRYYAGTDTSGGLGLGILDITDEGTPYTIGGGGPVVEPKPEPTEEPPGKSDPPGKGKKKGCKKGKGKKKGACPGTPNPTPAPACPAYVPGEEGAEAETTIVTDAATEEKPVVVELDSEAGLGAMPIRGTPVPYDETYHFFHNVQVDTAAADTGIYARLDFAEYRDYDLYLNYPDGTEADHSGDFNAIAGELGCGGTSCDSSTSHEAILGIRTPDCGGWTAEMVSYLAEGGPVTLSLWVGEVVADPAAPGGGEEALSTFYSLLGI
ncbi:MAG: hypothetical protein M3277_01465 [Actinomycetota bacterium]|nr:hypothetical protein [Actinomycetota bacterium]